MRLEQFYFDNLHSVPIKQQWRGYPSYVRSGGNAWFPGILVSATDAAPGSLVGVVVATNAGSIWVLWGGA
jgi:hypothetical protein